MLERRTFPSSSHPSQIQDERQEPRKPLPDDTAPEIIRKGIFGDIGIIFSLPMTNLGKKKERIGLVPTGWVFPWL